MYCALCLAQAICVDIVHVVVGVVIVPFAFVYDVHCVVVVGRRHLVILYCVGDVVLVVLVNIVPNTFVCVVPLHSGGGGIYLYCCYLLWIFMCIRTRCCCW